MLDWGWCDREINATVVKEREGNPSCVPVALLQHIRPRLTTLYIYIPPPSLFSFAFPLKLATGEEEKFSFIYLYTLLTTARLL